MKAVCPHCEKPFDVSAFRRKRDEQGVVWRCPDGCDEFAKVLAWIGSDSQTEMVDHQQDSSAEQVGDAESAAETGSAAVTQTAGQAVLSGCAMIAALMVLMCVGLIFSPRTSRSPSYRTAPSYREIRDANDFIDKWQNEGVILDEMDREIRRELRRRGEPADY